MGQQRPRLLLGLLVAVATTGPVRAGAFDVTLYGKLLERHTLAVTDPAGVRVDYRSLRQDADWPRVLESLARADLAALSGRDERLALWINAYNVLAIDMVRKHYPVESIRSLGSLLRPVWKRPAGVVGGSTRSLDEIEHQILRPLGEPRIHAAIVCAATSCPSLRREPFRAERLDAQLDDALRRWLADPRKGARLDREAGVLWLSRIFKWFEEDFESAGGVIAFVTPHLPEPARAWVVEHPDLRLRHFDYDWSLNDAARAPAAG